MTFLVPYDGSPLSRSALRRAVEFGTDERVVTLTVIPEDATYARTKGWLGDDEAFAYRNVADRLTEEVTGVAPDADVEFVRTERRPPIAKIAKIVRRKAVEFDASVVFLGSKSAGKLVTPITSVGSNVASDERFDVYVARHRVGD